MSLHIIEPQEYNAAIEARLVALENANLLKNCPADMTPLIYLRGALGVNDLWRRVRELEEARDEKASGGRGGGVTKVGARALRLMATAPSSFMLTATAWSQNSGGQFGPGVVTRLADLGFVDRLDRDGVLDPAGDLYRINQKGLDWLKEYAEDAS